MTHAPFHESLLRPASQVGPMHNSAGLGKLVNPALLSLINEVCMNVYRAGRRSGNGSRDEWILRCVVPIYL